MGYDGPIPTVGQIKGRSDISGQTKGRSDEWETCPDDPTHSLNAHAPGGSWYDKGHDGKPSPWFRNAPNDERINHPAHYNQYQGLEIIDLVEQMNFCKGNAIKYIARAGWKNPDIEIEDLEKAIWYIRREIDRIRNRP
jgi:hypothetical protein